MGDIEVLLYPVARRPEVKKSAIAASAQRRPGAPVTTAVRPPVTKPTRTPMARSIGLSAGTVHEKKKEWVRTRFGLAFTADHGSMRSTVVVAKSSPPSERETNSSSNQLAPPIRPAAASSLSSTTTGTGQIEPTRQSVKRDNAKFYAMPVPTYRLLFKVRQPRLAQLALFCRV